MIGVGPSLATLEMPALADHKGRPDPVSHPRRDPSGARRGPQRLWIYFTVDIAVATALPRLFSSNFGQTKAANMSALEGYTSWEFLERSASTHPRSLRKSSWDVSSSRTPGHRLSGSRATPAVDPSHHDSTNRQSASRDVGR